MPYKISSLLDHYRPDILVVTGHDSYSKAKGNISNIQHIVIQRNSWKLLGSKEKGGKSGSSNYFCRSMPVSF